LPAKFNVRIAEIKKKMLNTRPFVLSIAGFDPSAGAGVLADIKTFEACGIYGTGAISALTYQNDINFERVEWMSLSQILGQTQILAKRFKFEFIKIGLIEHPGILLKLLIALRKEMPSVKFIWDPILKASAGFSFHEKFSEELLEKICRELYLITPNYPEACQLGISSNAETNAESISKFCNVYLKGGHNIENPGKDILFHEGARTEFIPEHSDIHSKHGSGCVLSSAITASLAKGLDLPSACRNAKEYTASFLASTDTLLGYHSKEILLNND
jgi:hydroxymethylpyrimidine/phosphomethylpyrimidine kinase